MGRDWQLNQTSQTLSAMCAVEDFVFVGVYSEDRMLDYYTPWVRSLREIAC